MIAMTRLGFALMLLVVLGGCSTVTTRQPLGDPAPGTEQQKFEGLWLADDDVVRVRFDHAGTGHVGGLEWSNGAYSLVTGEIIITEGAHGNFISVRVSQDGKWEGYYFAQYHFLEHGDLVIWLPRVEFFAATVGAGGLKGSVDEDRYSTSVIIRDEGRDLLDVIDSAENQHMFYFKQPLVFRRLHRE